MMPDAFRPLPDDPTGDIVLEFFDARSEEWLLTAPGAYQTAAAETMREDGTDHQEVVILRWPARLNHSDELRTVQLMMAPEDAEGLAEVLSHTARWVQARRRLAN